MDYEQQSNLSGQETHVWSTVLRTLAFADAFSMPLTGFEVWQWLLVDEATAVQNHAEAALPRGRRTTQNTATLHETLQTLDDLVGQGRIAERWGYYAFPDSIECIEERLARLAIAVTKLRRARRWARWIVRLPYVRGVFADGSLATGYTNAESDLDVFVVLAPGRIFLGRLFVTMFTEMFGIRRTRTKITDRICLNHYATTATLAFPYRSAFTAWLWARIFPLALRDEDLANRLVQQNTWVGEHFPNVQRGSETARKRDGESVEARSLAHSFTRSSFDFVERLARKLQLRRIEKNPLTHKGSGRVVANDDMMLFHPELPEEEVTARYRRRRAVL